jgi:hypothetical protein
VGAAAQKALILAALTAVFPRAAAAEEARYEAAAFGELYPASCVQRDGQGLPYAVCFDLGNRLAFTAATDGFGGELDLRHVLTTDDTGVTWRFEHRGFVTSVGYPGVNHDYTATLYDARYTRHSREGYLTIPTFPPRKVRVPFDVGAEATVMRVSGRTDSTLATIRAIRAGAFVDLARSTDFRRRLTIGTAVTWDVDVEGGQVEVLEHRLAPFTTLAIDGYIESKTGLTRAGARAEGGLTWSDLDGWQRTLEATASIERVLVAVNDRPLTLYVEGRYSDPGAGLTVAAGVRFAVFGTRPWSPVFRVPEAAGP